MNQTQTTIVTDQNRFDYVKYDTAATQTQLALKEKISELAALVETTVTAPRAKALVLTKLEEAYMWIGKGVRDDQIARNGTAELQEGRVSS